LKYDIEATLNKKAARFMQRESIRQQANQSFKEKLSNFSLNLTIGGQGSDILIGNVLIAQYIAKGGVFCFCCHFIENAVDKFCFYIAWCVGKSGFGLSI
jgi:hypothetical protein